MRRGLRLLAACSAGGALAASASAGTTTMDRQLAFVWPARGTITTPFGGGGGRHEGIDIGTLRSRTIRAAAWGIVELTGRPAGYEGYGNVVVVRVTPTLTLVYAHLSSIAVRPGQRVLARQKLGLAGCTGICTGTHLHFEVREEGRPINPTDFLG